MKIHYHPVFSSGSVRRKSLFADNALVINRSGVRALMCGQFRFFRIRAIAELALQQQFSEDLFDVLVGLIHVGLYGPGGFIVSEAQRANIRVIVGGSWRGEDLTADKALPDGNVAPVKFGNVAGFFAMVLLVDAQAVLADEVLVAVLADVVFGGVMAGLMTFQIVFANELFAARRTVVLDPDTFVQIFDIRIRFQYDFFSVKFALVPLVLVFGREIRVAILATDHRGNIRNFALFFAAHLGIGELFAFCVVVKNRANFRSIVHRI